MLARSSSSIASSFRLKPNFHDALQKSSNARRAVLEDAPNVLFTVRPPPSQLPPSILYPVPSASPNLPPLLHQPAQAEHKTLSAEQIAEMQALRRQNPTTWTRKRLAKKFGCSPFFVGIQGTGDKVKDEEAKARHERRYGKAEAKWGPRKKMMRELRSKRRELW